MKRVRRDSGKRRKAIAATRKRTTAFSDLNAEQLVADVPISSDEAWEFQIPCEVPVSRFVEEVINQAHFSDSSFEKRKLRRSLKNDRPVLELNNMVQHVSGCAKCKKIFEGASKTLAGKFATIQK